MTRPNRRDFIEHTILTAAAAAAAPLAAGPDLLAPPVRKRDPIRVGVIGVRGRGRDHIRAFKQSPDAEVVAIAEPDEAVTGLALRAVRDATWHRDLREMLDRDDIDAVSIATPNHWHALAAVWALEAGKHVYVEKPLSHDLEEGRRLVAAWKKSGKVVQHGTQARSQRATREAMAWLHAGELGEVRVARALCYKRRHPIGLREEPLSPPDSIDLDLWTGPAALRPMHRNSFHYDWHWVWNTGNGDIGNQGVHQMDIAHWGLGLDGFPERVTSLGGRVGYEDAGETPNTQVALLDFGTKRLLFEVRGLPTPGFKKTHIGVLFEGAEGWLASSTYHRLVAFDPKGREIRRFEGGGDHYQNWLDAIRTEDPAAVTAPPDAGHVAAGLCHLPNVAHRLGTSAPLERLDLEAGLHADPVLVDARRRMIAHLEANALDAATAAFTAGPTLECDPADGHFQGPHAEEAEALSSRSGRTPFLFV